MLASQSVNDPASKKLRWKSTEEDDTGSILGRGDHEMAAWSILRRGGSGYDKR